MVPVDEKQCEHTKMSVGCCWLLPFSLLHCCCCCTHLGWRVDGDEDHVGALDLCVDVGGEKEVAPAALLDDLQQSRLVDGQVISVPRIDLNTQKRKIRIPYDQRWWGRMISQREDIYRYNPPGRYNAHTKLFILSKEKRAAFWRRRLPMMSGVPRCGVALWNSSRSARSRNVLSCTGGMDDGQK